MQSTTLTPEEKKTAIHLGVQDWIEKYRSGGSAEDAEAALNYLVNTVAKRYNVKQSKVKAAIMLGKSLDEVTEEEDRFWCWNSIAVEIEGSDTRIYAKSAFGE